MHCKGSSHTASAVVVYYCYIFVPIGYKKKCDIFITSGRQSACIMTTSSSTVLPFDRIRFVFQRLKLHWNRKYRRLLEQRAIVGILLPNGNGTIVFLAFTQRRAIGRMGRSCVKSRTFMTRWHTKCTFFSLDSIESVVVVMMITVQHVASFTLWPSSSRFARVKPLIL